MKLFKVLLLLIVPLNVWAIDVSVLDDNYPGFSDYELNSLTATRSYFRSLFIKSAQYSDRDGSIVLDVQNDNWESVVKIRILIEREVYDYETIERVKYQLSSGNTFEYILRREGKNIHPLKDQDLLMFKFQAEDSYDTYDILLPILNVNYHRELKKQVEKSFFYLGFMNFKLQIDTEIKPLEINRNYIFYLQGMTSPEQMLSVNALESNSDWNSIQYTHSTRGKGIINSKNFFEGLNNGAMLFSEASQIYLSTLYSLGFPKFE